jgi:acyl carrier protein
MIYPKGCTRYTGLKAVYLNDEVAAPSYKLERPVLSTDYVEPATEIEERLKVLFEHFFGIEKIGVEDDFFELGGDSLKAMMMLKRIKNEFNINLTVKDLFENPTVRGTGKYLNDIKMVLDKKGTNERKSIII